MVARKLRIIVVLDTNVLLRHLLAKNAGSFNRRVFRLWLFERMLQLVVSPELINEYLRILESVLRLNASQLESWRRRFEEDSRATLITPIPYYTACRDSDDDKLLDLARAGHAEHLITNDRDLLELPPSFTRRLSFAIVTPGQFLEEIEPS